MSEQTHYAHRLQSLKRHILSANDIYNHYGIDLRDSELVQWYKIIAPRLGYNQGIIAHDCIDRRILESVLQRTNELPLKLAAVHHGMDEDSLRKLLNWLNQMGIVQITREYKRNLFVSKDTNGKLYQWFTSLRNRTFSSHQDYCRRMHQAITDESGIIIKPVFCATGKIVDSENPPFASEYDIVSDEPISRKYELWIDFGKPLNLSPDYISIKTWIVSSFLIGESGKFVGGNPNTQFNSTQLAKIKKSLYVAQ